MKSYEAEVVRLNITESTFWKKMMIGMIIKSTSSFIRGRMLCSRHTGHNEFGFPFQRLQELRILPFRPFCFFFCWLRALSGSGSGGGGAPRAESPPAQRAACPPGHRLASRGSERKSETNSLSSSSRACSTLQGGAL